METPWNERDVRWALVYGLGLSGRAASRLLLALGARVVGVDARPAEALELGGLSGQTGFELRAGGEPEELPAAVDVVVVSPGVPLDRPLLAQARRRGVPVLAEVELAFPFLDGPLVGITGSNGKSTTTALAGSMLRAGGFEVSVCGNIGTPLSAEVDAAVVASGPFEEGGRGAGPVPDPGRERSGRVYVAELSSFQLQAIHRLRPRAAALLNLAADHLDRHGGLEAYSAAKRRIFEHQEPGDVAVVNADDPLVRDTVVRARRRSFSLVAPVEDGCFLEPGADGPRVVERGVVEDPGGAVELFRPEDSPLAGEHNLANAMAAALLARALGVAPEACRRGLADFRGLPHRMERVAEAGGVAWYDDSKGTNPAATLGCLAGLADGSVHLILGGRNKGADFRELAPAVARKARRVYLIGEAAGELEEALDGAAPLVRAGTLEAAVSRAAAEVRPGEVVLLSPACASFDQFRDFNDRGDAFQHLARAATGGAGGQEAGV